MAKDMEDLKNFIDPQLLPKEYGGLLPEAEHMENFDEFFKTVRPNLDKIRSRIVDWSKVPDVQEKLKETVGSFRKLEID